MYSSSSFFVQTRLRTRSSSFLVQVAPQRVPGHPEAKSCQNLIRNGLLEAILEASRPASKPARQAQPLGRVFSTKRARGQDRRVFSSRLVPKGSLDVRRPTSGRKNSSKQTGPHRKNSRQKINLLDHCRILCLFASKPDFFRRSLPVHSAAPPVRAFRRKNSSLNRHTRKNSTILSLGVFGRKNYYDIPKSCFFHTSFFVVGRYFPEFFE